MDFFPISVPKKEVFKSNHAEEEEEDENGGGLSLLLSQQPIEGDENSEWLSVFVEDCFSTSAANYHLAPAPTQTSTQIPVQTLKPQQQLQNPRKKRKKIIKHKTTPSFFDLDHFITELNADVDPPLLDQAHWLADSEPIFPIKLKHEPFTIKHEPKPEKDKEKKKVLKHRKCSHCQTEKTPLWRQGPSGKGTLCNACGVRWLKSGNLFPEYRPANSPTFVSDLHSNVLRKVLEMREAGKAASGGSSSS